MGLKEFLDVMAGCADEPTREKIKHELADPNSKVSLLAEGIRRKVAAAHRRAARPLPEEWSEFVRMANATGRQAEGDSEGRKIAESE
jgi:hypothetical protein